jgi:hypothetical protein
MPVTVEPVVKYAHQVRSATTKSAQHPLSHKEIPAAPLFFTLSL